MEIIANVAHTTFKTSFDSGVSTSVDQFPHNKINNIVEIVKIEVFLIKLLNTSYFDINTPPKKNGTNRQDFRILISR